MQSFLISVVFVTPRGGLHSTIISNKQGFLLTSPGFDNNFALSWHLFSSFFINMVCFSPAIFGCKIKPNCL